MRGLPLLLWQVYNLQDCQEDHPIRRAARALEEQEARIAKLEDEATRMMALARENGQLRDVARRERDALRPLALFGRDILEAHREDFGDIDGGTLQDTAERHGLLHRVEVDGPCCEGCNCAEYHGGDWPAECLRLSPTFAAAKALLGGTHG